jgi:hypothetical protein
MAVLVPIRGSLHSSPHCAVVSISSSQLCSIGPATDEVGRVCGAWAVAHQRGVKVERLGFCGPGAAPPGLQIVACHTKF